MKKFKLVPEDECVLAKDIDEFDDFIECKHEHLTESDFEKSSIHKLGDVFIISSPTTATFICMDCNERVPVFVAGGAFSIPNINLFNRNK